MRAAHTRMEATSIHRTGSRIRPGFEPAACEPDVLRDAVYKALSLLSPDERSDIRNKLLAALNQAGLRIHQCLFMLGVSARTVDELTAPEIAALIRYVRLTEPRAMMALAATITELLALADSNAKTSVRAA